MGETLPTGLVQDIAKALRRETGESKHVDFTISPQTILNTHSLPPSPSTRPQRSDLAQKDSLITKLGEFKLSTP